MPKVANGKGVEVDERVGIWRKGLWYHLYSVLMVPSEVAPGSVLFKISMTFCAVDGCEQIKNKNSLSHLVFHFKFQQYLCN